MDDLTSASILLSPEDADKIRSGLYRLEVRPIAAVPKETITEDYPPVNLVMNLGTETIIIGSALVHADGTADFNVTHPGAATAMIKDLTYSNDKGFDIRLFTI